MSQNGAVIRRLLSKNNKLSGLNRSSHANTRDNPKPRRSAAIKGSRKIGNSPSTHRNVGIMGSHSDSPKTRRNVGIRGIASNTSNNLRVHKTRSGITGIRNSSKANINSKLLDLISQSHRETPLWEFPVFTP